MDYDPIDKVEEENIPVLLDYRTLTSPIKPSKSISPYLQLKRKEHPRVQSRREKLAKIWRLKEMERLGIHVQCVHPWFQMPSRVS